MAPHGRLFGSPAHNPHSARPTATTGERLSDTGQSVNPGFAQEKLDQLLAELERVTSFDARDKPVVTFPPRPASRGKPPRPSRASTLGVFAFAGVLMAGATCLMLPNLLVSPDRLRQSGYAKGPGKGPIQITAHLDHPERNLAGRSAKTPAVRTLPLEPPPVMSLNEERSKANAEPMLPIVDLPLLVARIDYLDSDSRNDLVASDHEPLTTAAVSKRQTDVATDEALGLPAVDLPEPVRIPVAAATAVSSYVSPPAKSIDELNTGFAALKEAPNTRAHEMRVAALGSAAMLGISNAAPRIDTDRLLSRAQMLISQGDVSGARLILERALNEGSETAAFRLAETYDPRELSLMKVIGISANPIRARELYRLAADHGISGAKERLAGLE